MKAVFSLLALAGSALAGYGHGEGHETTLTTYETTTVCPITSTITKGGSTYVQTAYTTSTITVTSCAGGECGGEVTVTAPDTTVGTTTEVDVTYTTTCPVTETVTAPGSTYTHVYTTTSVAVTKVATVIYQTVTGPAVTKTAETEVYTTLTSLCPVTETKTVGGSTVVVTWTSTSTIKEVVPTTAIAYTSYTVTEHVSTEVYVTEECPETTYTTVSKGSTIYVTKTGTETVTKTKEYTLTETIPVTQTKDIEVTYTTEATEGETVTAYPTVWVTYSGSTIITKTKAPTTVNVPTTAYHTPTPSASSTAPVQVSSGLAPQVTQAIGAVLAGVAGVVAML
ncbi:hypothetical protein JX265_002689 [Neoarthrinium moseri]|uniref:Repetitive proline-rich cell wall protein n=1 Tax=Neoarthrinium moseri TaxID=1658444 RepID=A0A9P9WUW9_9PEZI|nr:uncharacterized protein JN550_000501 [Neoarthrinium moseri]KAI1842705.1 hypothetical protein JX266_011167 [Neoarthrinium moseri]KAI1878319.1 hypothetical protein JN550_000501 [Neoarthrinium moseri]KAI1879735.1 hypothetical protein JX265_002689 [Neoarthrinium moseri]